VRKTGGTNDVSIFANQDLFIDRVTNKAFELVLQFFESLGKLMHDHVGHGTLSKSNASEPHNNVGSLREKNIISTPLENASNISTGKRDCSVIAAFAAIEDFQNFT
jgi:hypothetical protein